MADIQTLLSILGAKKTSNSYRGGQWSAPCPFCGGKDRFQIWPYSDTPSAWCREENRWLPLNKLLKMYDLGEIEAPKLLPQKKQVQLELKDFINPAIVEEAQRCERDRVYKYFGGFGIEPDDCDRFRLGYTHYGPWVGFLIPHETQVGVTRYEFGAAIRRDDERAGADQPKYVSIKGSKNAGFFNTRNITLPGIQCGEQIDYLLIPEAEKDAILLDSLGFRASAFRPSTWWLDNLREALSNVIFPIIIQDNDDGPGYARTQKIKECLGRACEVVATEGVKSPSDLAAKSGREGVLEWVRENVPYID